VICSLDTYQAKNREDYGFFGTIVYQWLGSLWGKADVIVGVTMIYMIDAGIEKGE